MSPHELRSLLARAPELGVAVIGDFCLDAYWIMDGELSERSVETGLMTRPVGGQRYAPGGAGGVVSNLRSIGVGDVKIFGVIGNDPFGSFLKRLFRKNGADTRGLLSQSKDWDTHVYAKPLLDGDEERRMDFGAHNKLSDVVADKLLAALEAQLGAVHAVIINEQITWGIHGSAYFREKLAALILRHPDKNFVLDTRNLGDAYPGAIIKLNAHEANLLCGVKHGADRKVPFGEVVAAAETLYGRRGKPVVVTRGDRGCVVRSETGLDDIPGLLILGQTDPVGAGDCFVAAFAAAVGAESAPCHAARFGCFAAGVTVQKLRQTGTASPEEILAIGTDPDYVYRPELADDVSRAVYVGGTPFEKVGELPVKPTHVVFDHDGTISTLRVGWEEVMEPVMITAVLGGHKPTAAKLKKVTAAVREMIDKTTGVRTVAQMGELVKLVRDFGYVPEGEMLDAEGYKAVYLEALMERVRRREEDFRAGKTQLEDVTIKSAVEFLKALHKRGVALYLASGTDRDAVVAEATLLGYAHLFGGHIYGAERGAATDAKKMVIKKIFSEIGQLRLAGTATPHHVLAVGDGMVEMREAKKAGGMALGVASDENTREGLNPSKRSRLIRGGADMVIPDFGEWRKLVKMLFG